MHQSIIDEKPGAVAKGTKPTVSDPDLRAEVKNLNFFYGDTQAIKNINLPIVSNRVTALIGASGCGKSTLLRCFNRMHDLYPGNRYDGEIRLYPDDVNIVSSNIDPMLVRFQIGMVFQKPNPFPKSIFDNVAAGLTVRGIKKKAVLEEKVEIALRRAAIWDEVKDRLHTSAMDMSGGQQQRLCIARALAPEPNLLLLDEPTSALDPIATAKIEDLIQSISDTVTILIVTHNMHQASRISFYTAFMHMGEIVEYGETEQIFSRPEKEQTEAYISGRFG